MLRNRPLVPSESFQAAPRIASTTHNASTHHRRHRSLVVVPAEPAADQATREPLTTRPSLLDDLVRLSTHRLSAFLAEAAVLVLVLGILERFLTAHHIELRWMGFIVAVSATLLASSVLLELTGTRRAGHS